MRYLTDLILPVLCIENNVEGIPDLRDEFFNFVYNQNKIDLLYYTEFLQEHILEILQFLICLDFNKDILQKFRLDIINFIISNDIFIQDNQTHYFS